jgi:hypothetical protein
MHADVNAPSTVLVPDRVFVLGAQIEYYCHKIRYGEGELVMRVLAEPTGTAVNVSTRHCAAQPAHASQVMSCWTRVPAGCPRINKLAIDRFRFGLQWCLAKAVEMGLDIAITPHLDDGLEYGGWRNALWFNPLQQYGGFSYYDVSPGQVSCKPSTTSLLTL